MGKLAAERDRKEGDKQKRCNESKNKLGEEERTLAAAAKRLLSMSPVSYTMTQREQ